MVSIFKEAVRDALYPRKNGVLSTRNKALLVTPVVEMGAEDVRKLRKSLKLSSAYFAQILGVSAKTVEAWESGKNTPSGPAHGIG